MDLCLMLYYGSPNDDVFLTAVNTFRKNSKALLKVYSDSLPDEFFKFDNVLHIPITKEDYTGRRCLFKMKVVQDAVNNLVDGDRLLVSDADMYFLADPFGAFEKCDFHIGVTTRVCSYTPMVNAGQFFINVNDRARWWFGGYFDNYTEKNKEYYDWFIDQNFLEHIWQEKIEGIVDVGWDYNFCPNTDIFGVKLASDMVKRAYESRAVKTLHLKSELKMCIHSGYMKNAVIRDCNNVWNWKEYTG